MNAVSALHNQPANTIALLVTPETDSNFYTILKIATADELSKAVEHCRDYPDGNTTRIWKIQFELQRRY